MALAIVGGTVAVVQVGSAIAGSILFIKQITNDHDERLADISREHQEALTRLGNEKNKEDNKHKEFMEFLKMLKDVVSTLGMEIRNAKCEGCEGLPGNNND